MRIVFAGLALVACGPNAGQEFVQGAGAGLGGVNAEIQRQEAEKAAGARSCSSDYECEYGQRCGKQPYQSSGVCMRVVNQTGGTVIAPPRVDSVGVGQRQCWVPVDCGPYGFTCENGLCIKVN